MATGPIGGDAAPSIVGARVAAYAHNAGFSGQDLIVAVAVAKAESGWNAAARGGPNSNGTYDWGLWQINDIHKPSEDVKRNPVANAKAAYKVYADAGKRFKPWAAYNSGSYQKFMPEAKRVVDNLRVRGPEWERAQVAAARTLSEDPDNSSIVDDLTDKLNPAKDIAAYAGKLLGNFSAFVLALVLLILGIVIVFRQPIGKAASALPVGRVARAGRSVKAGTAVAKPARAVQTVAQRAEASVALSEARKEIMAKREAERSAEASAEFVRKFKANQAAYRASRAV